MKTQLLVEPVPHSDTLLIYVRLLMINVRKVFIKVVFAVYTRNSQPGQCQAKIFYLQQ